MKKVGSDVDAVTARLRDIGSSGAGELGAAYKKQVAKLSAAMTAAEKALAKLPRGSLDKIFRSGHEQDLPKDSYAELSASQLNESRRGMMRLRSFGLGWDRQGNCLLGVVTYYAPDVVSARAPISTKDAIEAALQFPEVLVALRDSTRSLNVAIRQELRVLRAITGSGRRG